MIAIDSPHTLGKFRQINSWRRLTLARLQGLRNGLLQTSRETGAALDAIINEVFIRLQNSTDIEWERRKAIVRQEVAPSSRNPLNPPGDRLPSGSFPEALDHRPFAKRHDAGLSDQPVGRPRGQRHDAGGATSLDTANPIARLGGR